MAQAGGCHCGSVRYTIEGEPGLTALCHCTDCRKITGSTYSTNAVYPDDAFKLTSGSPKTFTVKGESGNEVTSYFCGNCGSTLWRQGGAFPGVHIIKVGTLDDVDALKKLKPVAELYAPTRVEWVGEIPGAAQKQTIK